MDETFEAADHQVHVWGMCVSEGRRMQSEENCRKLQFKYYVQKKINRYEGFTYVCGTP